MSDEQQLIELIKTQSALIEKLSEKVDFLTKKVTNLSVKSVRLSKEINELKAVEKTKEIAKNYNSGIIIYKDNEKVSVSGDANITIKIREVLKANNAKWNRSKKVWEFEDKTLDEIKKIVDNAIGLLNIIADVVVEN